MQLALQSLGSGIIHPGCLLHASRLAAVRNLKAWPGAHLVPILQGGLKGRDSSSNET